MDPKLSFQLNATVWTALSRMMAKVVHSMDYCKCKDFWGRWVSPCVVGKEELAKERAERLYKAWDALGLGYIGP